MKGCNQKLKLFPFLAGLGLAGSSPALASDLYSVLRSYHKIDTPPHLDIPRCDEAPEACDSIKWKLTIAYNLLYPNPRSITPLAFGLGDKFKTNPS
ncbi:hypothetical protein WDW37_14870 [Bdellovibrionota bacterium FG-1]